MEKHSVENEFDLPLDGNLTAEQAEAIFAQGKDAVVFALLKLSKIAGEAKQAAALGADDPACPSGQKPAFVKENKSDKRKR
ncbi:MAG: hypothetical protein JEZ07_11730, partial [Phycisphaerae bacterium]|nr:hypothetical protein [Phycisphaerae bacterium]